MADSHTTATPEATKASAITHPPVPDVQKASEPEIDQLGMLGARAIQAIGGGSPETPPEQYAGALGQLSGRSQAGMLRQLQHSYGNSYVGRVIQTKLAVNQPGDIYEQEADRMADRVMTMPINATSDIKHQTEEKKKIQTKCEKCEEKQPIQRASDSVVQAQPDLESRLNNSKGGGSPLPDEVRSFMEPRFGADLSQVRVHTGAEAVQMNRELGAQAFTHGSDVYFGAGKSPGNNELTAHELTHVVQQTGSSIDSSIQRECGVDESCVEEPNAPYPEPNYTSATPEANASYPNKVLHGEAHYTPADANMSTPDGTEVYVDAPPQQIDTDTTTDVESQADTGAGGSPGLEQEAHEGGAEGGPNAPSAFQEPSQEPSDEESWWDRGIDWVENKVASGAHQLADKADGIPVLEQVADAGAWIVDQQTQLNGGILKGAGTMVGGIANMIVHPVDTVMGLEAMAEHAPMLPGVPNPLKAAHGLYDIAVNGKDVGEVANHVLNPIQSLQDDFEFAKKMVGGITKPYQQAIKQGKYSEALGRGIFDIGSLFLGGGAVGATTKTGNIAGKAGKAADIASDLAKAGKAADTASDLAKAGKAADTTSDVGKAADIASDVGKAAETGTKLKGKTIAEKSVKLAKGEHKVHIQQIGKELQIWICSDCSRMLSRIDDVLAQISNKGPTKSLHRRLTKLREKVASAEGRVTSKSLPREHLYQELNQISAHLRDLSIKYPGFDELVLFRNFKAKKLEPFEPDVPKSFSGVLERSRNGFQLIQGSDGIGWIHIKNGHVIGKPGKTMFPRGISDSDVKKLIIEAVEKGSPKTSRQADKLKIVYKPKKYGVSEMEVWVNKHTNVIETAYPTKGTGVWIFSY